MKANRAYARAVITGKGERALQDGHPWVYEGEIRRFELPSGESWDNNGSLQAGAWESPSASSAGSASSASSADTREDHAPNDAASEAKEKARDEAPDEAKDNKDNKDERATTALPRQRQNRNVARQAVLERRRRKEALNAPATDDEIIPLDALPDGSIVDVVNRKGTYLGTGLLSRHSRIRIRLVTRNANDDFSPAFWERKVRWAWEYRKTVMGSDATACRVIFSEADEFPGLIVDRFNDVLVTQTLSAGMERLKPTVFPALLKVFADDGITLRGIYERNDVATRRLEGLEQTTGWWRDPTGDASVVVTDIMENGVRYHVDVANGQKTGFFLDQKYNRRAVARIARGRRVLDCCTHTGSFALNAALGGAEFVRAVDVSETAIAMARDNAQLNGPDVVSHMDFTVANIFDLLPELERTHNPERFDFIILDPPAFTKSRKTVGSAERGYREINYRAMRILPRGGYLATCSCSHFMDHERFKRMIAEAAQDAGVRLRQIEERQQAPDHPIVWGIPETDYLKCFLFQVV